MNAQSRIADVSVDEVIRIAIIAVGGQGGGVLSNWIAELASRGGYAAQMTSVAGVAQRTGATIYYVEIAPRSAKTPVFALSPSAGDVDIVIASELMEAGRAILRGFVTPDKTTLIASSHRILAISEKQVPGDGVVDGNVVGESLESAARKTVCFDMDQIARDNGTMISASLFGGLARSGALPFEPALFEDVIRGSGRGVAANLGAFRDALAFTPSPQPKPADDGQKVAGPDALMRAWDELAGRAAILPAPASAMAILGLRKTVDYQDLSYGAEYLDRLEGFLAHDNADHGYVLTQTAAKYIANAMCYDDILRVADLKTRQSRSDRLRQEQQIAPEALARVTEYFHPRAQEIVSILPAGPGRWLNASPLSMKLMNRVFSRGRRIRTDRIRGYVTLWLIGGLRTRRRKLLRHSEETAHLDNLSQMAQSAAQTDYALACEILKCQRLIKGYSDTHSRGKSKFAQVISALELLRDREDAADWMRRLRDAALSEEGNDALNGAVQTIRSFARRVDSR